MENIDKILSFHPRHFTGKVLNEQQLLRFFDFCEAYWVHSGDPKDPHAELTSGKCSNGFIDCLKVLKYRNLSQILADQLAQKIRPEIPRQIPIWSIGSPMAGINFAADLSEALGVPIRMFTEKNPRNPKITIQMLGDVGYKLPEEVIEKLFHDPKNTADLVWNRMKVPPGHQVLQVEELTTTAKTLNAGYNAIIEGNRPILVDFLPYVAILVHRPPKLPVTHYGDRKVFALIEKEIWAVDPPCSLCGEGSKRLRPKQNWAELTGKK